MIIAAAREIIEPGRYPWVAKVDTPCSDTSATMCESVSTHVSFLPLASMNFPPYFPPDPGIRLWFGDGGRSNVTVVFLEVGPPIAPCGLAKQVEDRPDSKPLTNLRGKLRLTAEPSVAE